jgi:hypothetical protein
MANNLDRMLDIASSRAGFRHVPGIGKLSPKELLSHGYYQGFPCVYGHTIRDGNQHWCYECVRKIQSNNCAFDLNYAHAAYKTRLLMVWRQIPVGHFEDCWEAPSLTKTRIRFPSYRSMGDKQITDNTSAHKVIYQCTWGDVGKMFVTRICKNKACLNPLHLVSSWNRTFPPESIHPFDYEFNPEKLMYAKKLERVGDSAQILEREYKNTIQHPLVNKNTPDYDEDKTICYGPYVEEFG